MRALSTYKCQEINGALECVRHFPDWVAWAVGVPLGILLIVLIILLIVLVKDI